MFFLARVHGDRESMPDGYALGDDQLAVISAQIPGAPVTFEHAGIADTVRGSLLVDGKIPTGVVRERLALLARSRPERGAVGSVLEMFQSSDTYWYAIFTVDLPSVTWLITTGKVPAVSLTHIAEGDDVTPLELAVCSHPARPGSTILASAEKPADVLEYKRRLMNRTVHNTTLIDMADQEKQSHLEAILEKLPKDTRDAIENRLVLVQAKLEAAQKAQAEAEARVDSDEGILAAKEAQRQAEEKLAKAEQSIKTLEMTAASDTARLRQEISTLKAHIDPDVLENCSISDETLEALFTDNAGDVRRVMDRVLVAANTMMMKMKNASLITPQARAPVMASEPSKKRRLDTEPTSLLERALADTFEMK